jgi:hypothetical protein
MNFYMPFGIAYHGHIRYHKAGILYESRGCDITQCFAEPGIA